MAKSWTLRTNPNVFAKSRKGAANGLRQAAEHILNEANKRVPIEEGILEKSGTASVDEKGLRAAISYNTPYAVRQHEDMTLRHDDGRESKYLENAMNAEADEVRQIIAEGIRGELT